MFEKLQNLYSILSELPVQGIQFGKIHPEAQIVFPKTTIKIECHSFDTPNWYKEGKTISLHSDDDLYISSVEVGDSGLYQCEGNNDNSEYFIKESYLAVGGKIN